MGSISALDEYKEQYGIEREISAQEVIQGTALLDRDLWEINLDEEGDNESTGASENPEKTKDAFVDLEPDDSPARDFVEVEEDGDVHDSGEQDLDPDSGANKKENDSGAEAEDLWSIEVDNAEKEKETWEEDIAKVESDIHKWKIDEERKRIANEIEQTRLREIARLEALESERRRQVERQRQIARKQQDAERKRAEKKEKGSWVSALATGLAIVGGGVAIREGNQAMLDSAIKLGADAARLEGNDTMAESLYSISGNQISSSTYANASQGEQERCLAVANRAAARAKKSGAGVCSPARARERMLLELESAGCASLMNGFADELRTARQAVQSACN